jgi:hypothetical protein
MVKKELPIVLKKEGIVTTTDHYLKTCAQAQNFKSMSSFKNSSKSPVVNKNVPN